MLMKQVDHKVPFFDTTKIHIEDAFDKVFQLTLEPFSVYITSAETGQYLHRMHN